MLVSGLSMSQSQFQFFLLVHYEKGNVGNFFVMK